MNVIADWTFRFGLRGVAPCGQPKSRPGDLIAPIATILLLVALAGCGGGAATVYSGPAVVAHAQTLARVTSPASDLVADQAPTSLDFVLANGDSGTIAIWGTIGKAQAIIDEAPAIAKAAATAFGTQQTPHVERHGNVTVFWDQQPNNSDKNVLTAILATHNTTALTAPTAATAAPKQSAPATLDLAHGRVGDIAIGADHTTIAYTHGKVAYNGCAAGACAGPGGLDAIYHTRHGAIYVFYGRHTDRVEVIRFASAYFRTSDGIAVGVHIPLGTCTPTSSGACVHRWHGYRFTIGQDGSFYWLRNYNGLLVTLNVSGGTITTIDLFDPKDD